MSLPRRKSVCLYAYLSVTLLCFTNSLAHSQTTTRFERRNIVLSGLGVPDEQSPAIRAQRFQGLRTRNEFEAMLRVIAPNRRFERYARWDDQGLQVFQDENEHRVPDFSVRFAQSPSPSAAAEPPSLQELRVALDPGHFGNELDERMGKFAHHNGRKLYEGHIALQTCLRVANRLMDLGVRRENIYLTRTTNSPASPELFDDFPFDVYARQELLERADESWFQTLIRRDRSPAVLLALARTHPSILRMFPDREERPITWASRRTEMFALSAELRARAITISEFQPHVTVIVHYDLDGSNGHGLQTSANHVKVFIPGNILDDEMGTREERFNLVRQAMDSDSWQRSVSVSSAIAAGISEATGVNIASSTGSGAWRGEAVAPGVYPRNLRLHRWIQAPTAIAYVEALYYNYATEFHRLRNADQEANFDGQAYRYSARADDVAAGIVSGIVRSQVVGTASAPQSP